MLRMRLEYTKDFSLNLRLSSSSIETKNRSMNEIENAQFGQDDIERNVHEQIISRKFMVSHSG